MVAELGYQLADLPEFTRILGAAKLTGKTAGKTSFGLIGAVTGEEHATGEAVGLVARRFLVEPRTHFLVSRLQQDLFKGNSNVGLLATAVNRTRSGSAYAGGGDWSLFWRENTYQVSGQVAGSRTEDYGEGQRGYAGQVELGKRAGLVQGYLQYEAVSPGFDVNDLGFISRAGIQEVEARLETPMYQTRGPFRYRYFSLTNYTAWNYDRIIYQKELEMFAYLTLKNYWRVRGGIIRRFETLDDLDTRGGPPIEKPASTYAWFRIQGDDRKPVNGDFRFNWERDAPGSVWRSLSLLVALRPSTRVELSLQPRYTWNDDDAQWVANVDVEGDGIQDHFVYGELKSRVFDVIGRCNMVFTPDLTLQLYLQPFVAVGDYGNFKELARPKSYEFAPYADLSFNPDFRRRSMRSNLVLRWEYQPGSTLFLVWSQSRRDSAQEPDLQPWSNLRKSFVDEGANILLVKLNYWMNI